MCRKGMLERGKKAGLLMGNFANLENDFLRKATDEDNKDTNCLVEFKMNMSSAMDREIKNLESQMKSLEITIKNRKESIRIGISEGCFVEWSTKINLISTRFKQKYSNEFNAMYDYYFRLNKFYGKDWDNFNHDINDMTKKMCCFTENEKVTENKDHINFSGLDLYLSFLRHLKKILYLKRKETLISEISLTKEISTPKENESRAKKEDRDNCENTTFSTADK